jgi:hypothetical protein
MLNNGRGRVLGGAEALKESGRRYLTGGQMGWFKRICKQLGEMETYM